MDEKAALSLNKLNEAFKKQVEKRIQAGPPTMEKAAGYMSNLSSLDLDRDNDGFDMNDFVAAWKKYYPIMTQILGWVDFILPTKFGIPLKVIKGLLAAVNSQINQIDPQPA